MDFRAITLLIMAAVLFGIGFLVYSRGRRNIINISYSLFVVFMAIWSLSLAMFYISTGAKAMLLWADFVYMMGSLIASFFLYFSFTFPSGDILVSRFKQFLIFVPNIIFFVLFFFTDVILQKVTLQSGIKIFVYGRGHIFFDLQFDTFFIWSFINLVRQYKNSTGITKLQIKYIITGTSLGLVVAGATNVILPWFNYFDFLWVGPVASLIWIIFNTYAILKYHLLGIKVIAAEIFTIVISLVLLINLFVFKSFSQLIFNFLIFLGVSIFGLLLIVSVRKEIRSKEELAKLTAELQKAYEDLKVLDRAKSEFLSMASHQLRTPLSAIKGYISMLIDGSYGKVPKKAEEKLKNVFQSNERLIRLVNDLLDISKIEMGKMELDKSPTQLEDMIQSCCDEMKIGAEQKKLNLVFKKPETPLPKVSIDALKVRQVIMNLIDNAIRYTPKGEIELKAERVGSVVRISVRDTGEGLSNQEKKSIFERFSRGSAGLAHFVEGAGLGLYTAKKFLEVHKGRIWVESTGKDKGSTFFVELPIM